MKSNMKRIISALILAAAVLSVNSCRIIDWAPINLRVQVQDSEGNDLLDPENDNTWLLGTTISFRGITVDLEETNITAILDTNFKITDEYMKAKRTRKCVTYFAAYFVDQSPSNASNEVRGVYTLPYSKAMEKLSFESSREILRSFREYLNNK